MGTPSWKVFERLNVSLFNQKLNQSSAHSRAMSRHWNNCGVRGEFNNCQRQRFRHFWGPHWNELKEEALSTVWAVLGLPSVRIPFTLGSSACLTAWLSPRSPLCNPGLGTVQPSSSRGANSLLICLFKISIYKVIPWTAWTLIWGNWGHTPWKTVIAGTAFHCIQNSTELSDNTWEMVNNKLKTLQPQGNCIFPLPPHSPFWFFSTPWA